MLSSPQFSARINRNQRPKGKARGWFPKIPVEKPVGYGHRFAFAKSFWHPQIDFFRFAGPPEFGSRYSRRAIAATSPQTGRIEIEKHSESNRISRGRVPIVLKVYEFFTLCC
jgi:hypothetical protein